MAPQRPAGYQPPQQVQDSGVTAAEQRLVETRSFEPRTPDPRPVDPRLSDIRAAQPQQPAGYAASQPQAEQVRAPQPQFQQPQFQQPQAQQPQAKQPQVDPIAEAFAGAEEAALRDIAEDPDVKERDARREGNARGKGGQNRYPDADGNKPDDGDGNQRRQDKMRRKQGKNGKGVALPATTTGRALDEEFEKPVRKRGKEVKTAPRREWRIPWTAMSFLAMVLIPAAIATFYYFLIASPQYQVETQFSVRGTSQSSVATLGLSMIGGGTAQSGDSYIVTSYIESLQLIRDVQEELGIDLRQYYSRDNIDWLYRVQPDMPLEKFADYWGDMTAVSFNSTTGNTTLYVYAFTAEDAKAIADAVLKVSEKLVNDLSESNRQQVMQVASKQVDRAEERLRKVQSEVRKLREEKKVTDPATIVQQLNQQIQALQSQLNSTKTRLRALLQEVAKDAPQARSLQRTIDSLEAQITEAQSQLDAAPASGAKIDPSNPDKTNVAEVLNKFEELNVEQNFATQAYTTALAAFETAIAEAQKQERYFATFVSPTRPEIALYPLRLLDSFIAFLVLLAIWLVGQFLYRSFRDHAI